MGISLEIKQDKILKAYSDVKSFVQVCSSGF